MMKQDTILVSFVNSDNPILIVGRKSKKEALEVINAFEGDEAKELYERLIKKKGVNL